MSRAEASVPRRVLLLYATFYMLLAMSQRLGSAGLVPLAVMGLLIAPIPIGVALASGKRRRAGLLLVATGIAGLVGYTTVGAAFGLVAIAAIGIPVGVRIRRSDSYGQIVAVAAALMCASMCGMFVGNWNEMNRIAGETRSEFETALATARAENTDNLQALAVLEQQIWVVEHWPYLLFGFSASLALVSACVMVSATRNWLRRTQKIQLNETFRTMRPPDALVWLLIVTAVLWYVEQQSPSSALRFLSWNTAVALSSIYWLNGAGVVLYTLQTWRPHPLVAFFALLAVIFLVNMLTFVGLFDTWFGFRERVRRAVAARAARDDETDLEA